MNLTESEGQDTALARLLHSSGALDVPTLQRALLEVRSQRRTSGLTLAELLRARGLVERGQLEAALAAIQPGPGSGAARVPGLPALRDYEVVRELARGGMGAVYEVRRGEASFALKTILPGPGLGDEATELERFALEAEVLARLDHPHVVRIHAAELEGPYPYMIQDLLPGGTLEERLQSQGPLAAEAAVELITKLAGGLAQAHVQGVLHRDLKPLNVLFDDRGEPRLVDFGLARLTGQSGLTRTGELLGTPAYMAPEQAMGGEVDERTDVYALGAVLFACLSGRPPFEGSGLGILAAVVNDPPPSLRQLGLRLPAWLESVCLRALAKDPAERYPSARAMAAALEAEALEARVQPRRRARRLLLAAIPVALSGLLVAGLGAIGWRAVERQRERERDEALQEVLYGRQGIAALASCLGRAPAPPSSAAGWASRGLVAIGRGEVAAARRSLAALEALRQDSHQLAAQQGAGGESPSASLRQALIGGLALLEAGEGAPDQEARRRALAGAEALASARSRLGAPELLSWEARLRARARARGGSEAACGLSVVAGLLVERRSLGPAALGSEEAEALLSALRRTELPGPNRLPRVPSLLKPFASELERALPGTPLAEVARILSAHHAAKEANSAPPRETLAALRAVELPGYLEAYGADAAPQLVRRAQSAFERLPRSSLRDLHAANSGERQGDWLRAYADSCDWLELLWLLDPGRRLPDAPFALVRERAARTIAIPRPPDVEFLRGEVSEELRRDFTLNDRGWLELHRLQARLVTTCLRRWPDDPGLAGRLLRHGATLCDYARLFCVPGVELLAARSEGATADWLRIYVGFLYARSAGRHPARFEELCERALEALRPYSERAFELEVSEALRSWWGSDVPDPSFLFCYAWARGNAFLHRSREALSWYERIPADAVGSRLVPWRVEYIKHRASYRHPGDAEARAAFAAETGRLALEALRRTSTASKGDLLGACWLVRAHLTPGEHAELLRRMRDPARDHFQARIAVSHLEQRPPQRAEALASLAEVPGFLAGLRRGESPNPHLERADELIRETLSDAEALDDERLARRLREIERLVQAAAWHRNAKARSGKD